MASKTQKKNKIRQDIIEAASMYEQYLAGQAFLYVYGNEYFEVMFPVNRFLHLAGVETRLFAKKFYKNAREKTLTTQQFYFSPRHPFEVSKKKLSCLKRLYELTNTKVRILRNMETASVVYKVGISNLEFTLCLTENRDSNGEKLMNTSCQCRYEQEEIQRKMVMIMEKLTSFFKKTQALESIQLFW